MSQLPSPKVTRLSSSPVLERAPGRDGAGGQCNWPVERSGGENLAERGQGPCPHLAAVCGQGRVRILRRSAAQGAASAGGALHREQCPHHACIPRRCAAQRAAPAGGALHREQWPPCLHVVAWAAERGTESRVSPSAAQRAVSVPINHRRARPRSGILPWVVSAALGRLSATEGVEQSPSWVVTADPQRPQALHCTGSSVRWRRRVHHCTGSSGGLGGRARPRRKQSPLGRVDGSQRG